MAAEQEIQPYEETTVDGTPFVVYHQFDEESYVHVQDDGSIRLCSGPDWVVSLAPTGGAT